MLFALLIKKNYKITSIRYFILLVKKFCLAIYVNIFKEQKLLVIFVIVMIIFVKRIKYLKEFFSVTFFILFFTYLVNLINIFIDLKQNELISNFKKKTNNESD